jgi:lipoate-protein ligase A
MRALDKLGGGNPLLNDPAYLKLKEAGYVTVPKIVSVTPHDLVEEFDDADFSPETIRARMLKGFEETKKVLKSPADWRDICQLLTEAAKRSTGSHTS